VRRSLRRKALVAVATALTLGLGTVGAASAQAAPKPADSRSTACGTALSSAELTTLGKLSDTKTLKDLHDGEARMRQISDILTKHNDRRGIFALFYRNILADANPVLDKGKFDDPTWARNVSRGFFVRYLENLHGNVTGGAMTPEWGNYYRLAADCKRSSGRVAAAGLDAHLIIDFPNVVASSGAKLRNTRDFFAIGDSLISTTTRITDELSQRYGAELGGFFHLYFVGTKIDAKYGKGITTYVLFQGIRGLALSNGLALESPWFKRPTQSGMKFVYNTAEVAFNGLELARAI
jgi:hypothetical protein